LEFEVRLYSLIDLIWILLLIINSQINDKGIDVGGDYTNNISERQFPDLEGNNIKAAGKLWNDTAHHCSHNSDPKVL